MMKQTRRKYDRSFKQKAVELANARGSVPEIARELGIKSDMLYRWRREFTKYKTNSFPGQGNPKMTDLERENARLKKELRDSRIEGEILKKAISIFSKSDGKSTNL
jgi:transposase